MTDTTALSFEADFFKPEIRNGFAIEGLMKCAWAAQMEVLSTVDSICRKHNITWFADSGTLLGAVRHHGFIPWDDDIDIVMKRPDYESFRKIMLSELPEDYVMLVPGRDKLDTHCAFIRIINSNRVRFDDDFLQRYHNFPYTAGIDIFPLDGVPDDKEDREILCNLINIVLTAEMNLDNWDDITKEEHFYRIEDFLGITLDRSSDMSSQLLVLSDALAKSYSVDECSELTCYSFYVMGGIESTVSKIHYDHTVLIPFENIRIPVPCGYREACEAIFGSDYMTPIRGSQFHDYPYYKLQKADAHEKLNHVGHERREQWVADKLGVNITEVFEMSELGKGDDFASYRYFCQGKFVTVDIPVAL